MSLKQTIMGTAPTSYWPLDEAAGSANFRDERGLHDGVPSASGVELAAVPFGAARMPRFDGELGSAITIPDDALYSHAHANALTVACWVNPSVLDFRHTQGSNQQYIHFIEKACTYVKNVEWAFRLYNATNPDKKSRLSFYLFNLKNPPGYGAGAYMEYCHSLNDCVPVEAGRWLFLVGQGESWIDETEECHGAIFYKQGVQAKRSSGDKYNHPNPDPNSPSWNVRPQHGPGVITIGGAVGKTAFCGAVGHVALWNRLLTDAEVTDIFAAGRDELTAG